MRRLSRMRNSTATSSAGFTSGSVMCRKEFHALDPSILAAS